MKRLLIVVAVFLSVSGYAQKTADIGIWMGASSYWGDMTKVNYGESINQMYGAFFRYNFNARYSLRTSFLTGKIGAVGDMENTTWEFNKTAHDFTLMMEINYLKYILGAKNTPFTPYIMGGIGVMYYPYFVDPAALSRINPSHNKGNIVREESIVATSIPFGMGVKWTFGKRLGVGVEVQFRKLLDDKLDDLDDPLAHVGLVSPTGNTNDAVIGDITYTDTWHNNDYVPFFGVNLTYSINLTNQVCPVYDSKK